MAEPRAFLAVALSGRALAVAARRAGVRVHVLDLFGDSDTRDSAAASRVVAGSIEHGFDADALLAAADEIAPPGTTPAFGLVYGSGLEDRPGLLARLCVGRSLCGNPPDVVARTKDPRAFFAFLERAGIPCPAVSFTAPDDPAGWLSKRVGASGGSHVAPAEAESAGSPDRYFQRRVPGRPVGVSFLGDGRRARLVGFSEQWPWRGGSSSAFRFGGALQPAPLAASIRKEIPTLLDAVVGEIGLVGLNSLDMMVDGERYWVIEVNPRPGANLDIFHGTGPMSLFEAHLRACRGELPQQWPQAGETRAMAVVYAERPSRVPAAVAWEGWVADRPAPGARIEEGQPVCTVLAAAPDAALVRALADRRVAAVLARLQPDGATDLPERPQAASA